MKTSAGVLIYKWTVRGVVVLLVHPSGREDVEPWSIPKGEFDTDLESPLQAAVREVKEELGFLIPESQLEDLGQSTYKNKRKRVYGFAWEALNQSLKLTLDPREIKKAEYCQLDEAEQKLHEAQRVFLNRLVRRVVDHGDRRARHSGLDE